MGNTGASRGMHLHYGHRKGMVSGSETFDPADVSALYR
jgi:murein DD-endopeptidase MepM/ murein hydrolase activator NlpD